MKLSKWIGYGALALALYGLNNERLRRLEIGKIGGKTISQGKAIFDTILYPQEAATETIVAAVAAVILLSGAVMF